VTGTPIGSLLLAGSIAVLAGGALVVSGLRGRHGA
jgi:hypothetical protein